MDEKAPAEGHLALADGQPHEVGDWEKAAAAVLRKAGRLGADDPDSAVWDMLTRPTLDGIGVPPLGTRCDLVAGLPDAGCARRRAVHPRTHALPPGGRLGRACGVRGP